MIGGLKVVFVCGWDAIGSDVQICTSWHGGGGY